MCSGRYTGPGRVWGSPWAVNWSWKGVGITLDSKLVLEGCEHLGEYSSEACMTISWSVPGLESDSSSLDFATVVGGCTQRDILVLEGCEHLGGYSFEMGTTISWCAPGLMSLESITELEGHSGLEGSGYLGLG